MNMFHQSIPLFLVVKIGLLKGSLANGKQKEKSAALNGWMDG